jgi:hypothetical protein
MPRCWEEEAGEELEEEMARVRGWIWSFGAGGSDSGIVRRERDRSNVGPPTRALSMAGPFFNLVDKVDT